jgi:hypothetical protein
VTFESINALAAEEQVVAAVAVSGSHVLIAVVGTSPDVEHQGLQREVERAGEAAETVPGVVAVLSAKPRAPPAQSRGCPGGRAAR